MSEPLDKEVFQEYKEGEKQIDERHNARLKKLEEQAIKFSEAHQAVQECNIKLTQMIEAHEKKIEDHEKRIYTIESGPNRLVDMVKGALIPVIIGGIVAAIMFFLKNGM